MVFGFDDNKNKVEVCTKSEAIAKSDMVILDFNVNVSSNSFVDIVYTLIELGQAGFVFSTISDLIDNYALISAYQMERDGGDTEVKMIVDSSNKISPSLLWSGIASRALTIKVYNNSNTTKNILGKLVFLKVE
jgi:hypothetical protein